MRPMLRIILAAGLGALTLAPLRGARAEPLGAGDSVDAAVAVVRAQYAGSLDDKGLRRGALEGLMIELDRQTGQRIHAVLSAPEARERQAYFEGMRRGVALEFVMVPGQGMVVTDVFPGGPADKAGVKLGDLIVGIDDRPLTGLGAPLIHQLLVRSTGDRVQLDIRRDGKLRRVSLQRGTWHLSDVRVTERDGVQIIRVPYFGRGVSRALTEATRGLKDASDVILDLRSNEGGLLDEAVASAALFVEDGAEFGTQQRPGQPPQPLRVPEARKFAGRIIILANRATAGAAEAFTAAVRTNGQLRVRVVGTETAGFAALPGWRALEEDLVIQVADSVIRGPDGASWAGKGIAPDVLSGPLELPLAGKNGELPLDVQLETALRLLRRD